MKKLILILFVALPVPFLFAGEDNVTVSGVDSRGLAVTGTVDVYAVATDENGATIDNLESGDFILRDAPAGGSFGEELDILSFSPAGEPREGISFLMLIDDSASMYNDTDGNDTDSWELSRAALARDEARRFLSDLGGSMDRAGLAVFGTRYRLLAGPRTDRISVGDELGPTEIPVTEEAYTELFASVAEAAGTMAGQKGRRIVILFSDGVNFPFAGKRGEPHPEYGMVNWAADDALQALREEAVTLYAVRFGPDRDGELARIARATGGMVFDVDGAEGLGGLYASIRDRVLAEYRISYRPRPGGAPETVVELSLAGGGSGEISYLSGFVLGEPSSRLNVLLSLLAIPAAALIFLLLYRLRAAARAEGASLSRLRPSRGETPMVALETGRTVIAPGPGGSGTVIMPEESSQEAPPAGGTILVEQGKDGKWRASGPDGVVVNNRKVDSTVLEEGDVIRAGEELIVFENGSD